METALTLLTEIKRLTEEQRRFITLEDKTALEQSLEQKERLIEALKALTDIPSDGETGALLESISRMERENMQAAREEMDRLRDALKKTQEGMMTVRGYDAFSAGVGATYIDKKK